MKDSNDKSHTELMPQDIPFREDVQRPLRQVYAKMSGGSSPASTLAMIHDWALHLTMAPDKQIALARTAQDNWISWMTYLAKGCPDDPEARPIQPQKGDRRFSGDAWAQPPFAAMAQGFLLHERFVDQVTSDIPGLDPAHDRAMTFLARQMLDAVAPSNFLTTNPEALQHTIETKGANLRRGAATYLKDYKALSRGGAVTRQLEVGKDVACSPGKVVFRTHLMELIQYEPTTKTVHSEPVLFVPAWIMKYYILDLSPENSMVKYLTSQGFTVFMISWRNPGKEDADLGMSDYLQQGPMAALDKISELTGASKIHTAGYCLGGTLLSIAAAAMARDGDDRPASMTLFCAQTDFSEPGELSLFINESQVSFLEDVMEAQGYLDASQMMQTFQMMRPNDLIWSRVVRSYLLGEDDIPMNDLMSWNADTTRMPARMHSEYLRHMFLNNDLATGRYEVAGHPISLRDIRHPVFAVGTETDHIAPWKSVFKIHMLGHADVTFALTNGGHNAGVLSEPGHKRRHFRLHTTKDSDRALGPDDWEAAAELHEGSWWPAWSDWLANLSGKKTAPPAMGPALSAAPGDYVNME